MRIRKEEGVSLEKKIDLSAIATDAGKSASTFLGKAKKTVVKAVDQNDDGTFDLKDVSVIADTIGNAAKSKAASLKDSAVVRGHELELAQLRPIFSDDLESPDFSMPKLVRITEIDKKHAESELCRGSIGYMSNQKEMRILNIFKNCADAFGLSFYPDLENEMYYIDPCDRDHYIALDDYFNYMKVVRVNELQKIAQDLGAKHFRVTYREMNSNASDNTAKGKLSAKVGGQKSTADAEHSLQSRDSSTLEIAAENIFPGHEPVEPKIFYLQKEPAVLNLIRMRMDKTSPTQHEKFSLSLINSSGIKEKDAAKIDATLKAMKVDGSVNVASEVKKESRRYFEFEADF